MRVRLQKNGSRVVSMERGGAAWYLVGLMTFADPSGFEVEAPPLLFPDELLDVDEPHPYVGMRTPLSPQAPSPAVPTKNSADDSVTNTSEGGAPTSLPGEASKGRATKILEKALSYFRNAAELNRARLREPEPATFVDILKDNPLDPRQMAGLDASLSDTIANIIEYRLLGRPNPNPRRPSMTLGIIMPIETPVLVRVPSGASIPEIGQVLDYTQASQEALEEGSLSPTGRVSTKGLLRRASSREAAKERAAAEESGEPYTGVAGHRPDTTWTKNPVPPKGFADYSARVNSSIGGQAGRYPVGYKPDAIILSPGVTLPPPASIAATPTVIPPP